MKIYVAGKFEDKETIRAIYKKIEELGHEISYDWTTHQPIRPYADNPDRASYYSSNEIKGILDSDIFICLTHDAGKTLLMEFGAALLLSTKTGKPLIYAVGDANDRSQWHFNKKVLRRDTIDEVLEEIKSM